MNADLNKQMDAVRSDAEEGLAQAENLAALTTMQEEAQKAIERLKKENEQLRAMKGGGPGQVEGELRTAEWGRPGHAGDDRPARDAAAPRALMPPDRSTQTGQAAPNRESDGE